MTATPYRVVNWNPGDLIGEDKMGQIVNNTQWLYENSPRAVYTLPSGLRRAENVRIASGRAIIPAQKTDAANVSVNFANLFSSGCEPNIVYGIVAHGQGKFFVIINGLGTKLMPDNRGFQIYLNVAETNVKNDRIMAPVYINWQAMGY